MILLLMTGSKEGNGYLDHLFPSLSRCTNTCMGIILTLGCMHGGSLKVNLTYLHRSGYTYSFCHQVCTQSEPSVTQSEPSITQSERSITKSEPSVTQSEPFVTQDVSKSNLEFRSSNYKCLKYRHHYFNHQRMPSYRSFARQLKCL